MKEPRKLKDIVQSNYERYVDKNEEKIVNDFCRKIKEERIGDLTLQHYSKFCFCKSESDDSLKDFYKTFINDTKDSDISFDEFCEYTWLQMESFEDEMPSEVENLFKSLKVETDVIAKA